MYFSKRILLLFCLVNLLSSNSFANNEPLYIKEFFNIEGSTETTINVNKNLFKKSAYINNLYESLDTFDQKKVKLMKITHTPKMITKMKLGVKQMIANGGEKDYSNGIISFKDSIGSYDLGMANVPVLDQNPFGTCVTFATTGALNARFKQGDYIDQQCSLALDATLGENYWNGAWAPSQIIDPLKQYGIIKKNNCFGVRYPNPSQTVDLNAYKANSDKTFLNLINTKYMRSDLNEVKNAIRSGHRVLMAFSYVPALKVKVIKNNGIQTKESESLWACPNSNDATCGGRYGGHEVIITGFDDNQQLLKIRNSWGSYAGDEGDYYMTYNYFNIKAVDQTIVFDDQTPTPTPTPTPSNVSGTWLSDCYKAKSGYIYGQNYQVKIVITPTKMQTFSIDSCITNDSRYEIFAFDRGISNIVSNDASDNSFKFSYTECEDPSKKCSQIFRKIDNNTLLFKIDNNNYYETNFASRIYNNILYNFINSNSYGILLHRQ
jgi:hypothetical protein